MNYSLTFTRVSLILFLFSQAAFSQTKDTLYFFNNTKVVGELQMIKLGRIQFDADGIGVIKVKNSKVESIHAQSHQFRIETINQEVLQGVLMRGQQSGNVIIHSLIETKEIDLQDITNLVFYGKSWRSRIDGNIGAGYSYTKSSEIGRFNLNEVIRYNTARGQTKLEGDMIITADSTQVKWERGDLNLGYTYSFSSQWIAAGNFRHQRNLELGLDRRWQESLGIGYKVLVRTSQQLFMLTGLALNQELNLEGTKAINTEVIITGDYNLFSFENPNVTIDISETGYLSLSQKGRYRFDGDIDLNWELISDFSINLQFYHSYDSQSPATGEANVDFGFVAGLSFEF